MILKLQNLLHKATKVMKTEQLGLDESTMAMLITLPGQIEAEMLKETRV